jgi:hypothetical protein
MMTMSNAMTLPVINRWKGWIIVILLPLLGACSTLRVTYGQGPLLTYWWLDRQVDFNAEQGPRVRAALNDWFAWHRATQLPEYAQALGEAAGLARGDLSPTQVCSQVEAWQRRAERAFERAVPAAAEQLRSLSAAQIHHLEEHQADKHQEAQKELLQPDPAERREATLKRWVERAEKVYGRLDDAQRAQLGAALAASPFDPARWLAERRARTQALLQALRQWQADRADATTVEAGVRRLAAEIDNSPRPGYAAYARRVQQANCTLIAQLHNGTTTAQRQKAAERLLAWQADFRTLAGQAEAR